MLFSAARCSACSGPFLDWIGKRFSGERLWLFDKSGTKNWRPVEVHCPDHLAPHIERYRHVYRPIPTCPSDTDAPDTSAMDQPSWRNNGGGGYSKADRGAYEAGLRPEHQPALFRDCAATSIAVHDPERVRIASVILGHARSSTTEKYYNQAQMLTAGREHNREILNLRKKARSWRSRRPSKP